MLARLMGLRVISPKDLHLALQNGKVTVCDVNAQASWERARVPGALQLDPDLSHPDLLPTDRGASLVFYCSNPLCRKAPLAARRAKGLGYTDVRVLSAGIRGWVDAGLPTESGPVPAS